VVAQDHGEAVDLQQQVEAAVHFGAPVAEVAQGDHPVAGGIDPGPLEDLLEGTERAVDVAEDEGAGHQTARHAGRSVRMEFSRCQSGARKRVAAFYSSSGYK
jgi:hypothetical protein